MKPDREKTQRYARILTQARKLLAQIQNPVARMATVSALLHHKIKGFSWTGFYLLQEGELIVGPYQGLLACIKLKKHQGVCWAALDRGETVVVKDVHEFPGHIACDSRSQSEIVLPVRKEDGTLAGVLDIDSTHLAWFDDGDAKGLAPFADLIYSKTPD